MAPRRGGCGCCALTERQGRRWAVGAAAGAWTGTTCGSAETPPPPRRRSHRPPGPAGDESLQAPLPYTHTVTLHGTLRIATYRGHRTHTNVSTGDFVTGFSVFSMVDLALSICCRTVIYQPILTDTDVAGVCFPYFCTSGLNLTAPTLPYHLHFKMRSCAGVQGRGRSGRRGRVRLR